MKGFTLPEILIAITISALAGVLLISFLVQNNGLFMNENAKVSQGLSLNDASSQITNAVKSASSIATQYPQSSPQFFTGAETLILALPSIDSQSQIIENVYDYYVVTKDPQNPNILRKYLFPSAGQSQRSSENQVLATNLSSLKFLYLDESGSTVSPSQAAKVNFSINLTTSTGINSNSASASGEVNLKNN